MVARNVGFRFTLVSYNILSQSLLHEHSFLYTDCDPKDLEWPRRGHRIVSELLDNQADIICLQEVENDHLKSLYRPRLNRYGYDCLYKRKTGFKIDGCAIFYKRNLFQLIHYKPVQFNRRDIANILNRDNIGIIAVLKPKLTNITDSQLVVANTHLLFNPSRDDIRLAQMKLFLSELETLSFEDQVSDYPTILCGDLNSLPDSRIVKYITQNNIALQSSVITSDNNNQVDNRCEQNDQITNGTDSELCPYLNQLRHPFDFTSAYRFYKGNGQPLATTFSSCIVDYIFHTPKLKLESYKELLTEDQMRSINPMPNCDFPSDHIPLVARYTMQ